MFITPTKTIRIMESFFLMAMLLGAGCQRGTTQIAVETIVRDASLICSAETANRCAILSEFQDLADSAFEKTVADGTHYVSILDVGEDALLARIHLVRAARESIDIQTFIWDDDEVGQALFTELLEAALRGIKVRMILDQFGTYVSVGVMAQMAVAHENIDIMFFRPVMNKGSKSAAHEIGSFVTDPKTLNKRMHNKLFVVDGRIGIVGGRNIENAYYDYDSSICFKDLDLLVVGPEAGDMVKSFNKYWEHDLTKPALEMPDVANQAIKLDSGSRSDLFEDSDLSILDDLRKEADSYSIVKQRPVIGIHTVDHVDYVADWPEKKNPFGKEDRWNSTQRVDELVTNAEYEILMQTPYLIQDRKGMRNFRSMREQRPDLRIALSTNSLASTDMFYVYAMCFKQRQFYLETAQTHMYEFKPVPGDVQKMVPRYAQLAGRSKDVDVYETPDAVLPIDAEKPRLIVHAKFFVIDDHISFVGSHNFDPRANNLNTESAVIIWDDDLAEALKAMFNRDTAPQNSWVVARRQKSPHVGNVSEMIAGISSKLPFFDIWPFEYSSNFDLKEGFDPLAPDHPDFYEHYEDVGVFPQMGLSYQNIGTRFVKAFGGLFRDLM